MSSPWFYSSLGVGTASTHAALILFMTIIPVFTYFVSPLFSALSRKHEFEADEFAHSNSNYKALISALVNLYRENAAVLPLMDCFKNNGFQLPEFFPMIEEKFYRVFRINIGYGHGH